MNVFVFDSQAETSQIWQELASAHGFRVNVFHNSERLVGLAAEAQILVVDQSVMPVPFMSNLTAICRQYPSVQVVATGHSLTLDDAVDLMRDGAALVIAKPLSRHRIERAIPTLLRRVQQLSEWKQEYDQLQGRFSKLTTREKDVLSYILCGTSNKETAQLLKVSVRTIESRRAKVYRKLDASHVAELVRKIDRLENLGKELGVQLPVKAKLELAPPQSNGHASFNPPHRLPQTLPVRV